MNKLNKLCYLIKKLQEREEILENTINNITNDNEI